MTVFAGSLRTNQMESHEGSLMNTTEHTGQTRTQDLAHSLCARSHFCLCKDASLGNTPSANFISSIPLAAIKLRLAEVDVAFRQSILNA